VYCFFRRDIGMRHIYVVISGMIFLLLAMPLSMYSGDINSKSNASANIIILIDDGIEGVDKNACVMQTCLLAALQDKCTCLVSTSVWQSVLEKRSEIEKNGKIQGTQEYKALAYLALIQKEFARLLIPLEDQKHADTRQNRQAVLAAINQKFWCTDAVKHNEALLPSTESLPYIFTLLAYYLVPFKEKEWIICVVNQYFRLLVHQSALPSDDKTILDNNFILEKDDPYTDKETYLGLAIDHLEKRSIAQDLGFLSLQDHYRPEGIFIQTVRDVFISKLHEENNKKWNIFLSGHGNNTALPKYKSGEAIANISIVEFRDFLKFLEHEVMTALLFYHSCYAGGQHLELPYTTDGNPDRYSYTIITNCLGDAVAMGFIPEMPLHTNIKCKDIEWKASENNQYALLANYQYQFKKFFKKFSCKNFIKESTSLLNLIDLISVPRYSNISWVRYSNSEQFILLCPDNGLKIDAKCILVHDVCNIPLSSLGKVGILIEAPYVWVPVVLCDNQLKLIWSISPGNACHLFEEIDAEIYTLDNFIGKFEPMGGSTFTKVFLIKKLILTYDDRSPFAHLMKPEKNTVSLCNVMIVINRDSIVRFFFEHNEEYFSGYARSKYKKAASEVRLIECLDDKATAMYIDRWNVFSGQAHERHAQHKESIDQLRKAIEQQG
jgi:hypothetical protein